MVPINFNNRTFWVGAVLLLVIGALLYWWASSGLPLSTWTGLGIGTATTTDGTPDTSSGGAVSTSNQDVASIVAGLSNASQFKALFTSSGVAATINPKSTSKYTIFVPTDGSMRQLAPGTISNLTAAEKKRLVQYHVISGRELDADALVAGQMTALSGDSLNFNYGANGIPMVNSSIIISEYRGTNGTVYVIDNVLLPPKKAN